MGYARREVSIRRVAGLVALASTVLATACSVLVDAEGSQLDDSWTIRPENNHGYRLEGILEWQEGQNRCVELGGHLATLSDDREQLFVETLIDPDVVGTYVGFYCGPECSWVDDTPFPADPPWLSSDLPEGGTGPCGEVFTGRWTASSCNQGLNVVCEIER